MTDKELYYFLNIFGDKKGKEIKIFFKKFKNLQKIYPGLKNIGDEQC